MSINLWHSCTPQPTTHFKHGRSIEPTVILLCVEHEGKEAEKDKKAHRGELL